MSRAKGSTKFLWPCLGSTSQVVVWKNSGGFYSQTSQKHYSKKCPKISVLDAFNPNFGPPVFQDTFGILVSVVLMQRSSERSATEATGEGFGPQFQKPKKQNNKNKQRFQRHMGCWHGPKIFVSFFLFFWFSGIGRGEVHPQNWGLNNS